MSEYIMSEENYQKLLNLAEEIAKLKNDCGFHGVEIRVGDTIKSGEELIVCARVGDEYDFHYADIRHNYQSSYDEFCKSKKI